MFADVNNTELSQKVEAQLFEQYDAMVPGPAASLVAAGATSGDPDGTQERTGRPLAINLDLLSYHARQKALAVSLSRGPFSKPRLRCWLVVSVVVWWYWY